MKFESIGVGLEEFSNCIRCGWMTTPHFKLYSIFGRIKLNVRGKSFSVEFDSATDRLCTNSCQEIVKPYHLNKMRIEFCSVRVVTALACQSDGSPSEHIRNDVFFGDLRFFQINPFFWHRRETERAEHLLGKIARHLFKIGTKLCKSAVHFFFQRLPTPSLPRLAENWRRRIALHPCSRCARTKAPIQRMFESSPAMN